MGFHKQFRSIGGMIQDVFGIPWKLGTFHTTYPETGAGQTNAFDLWQQLYWDNDGLITLQEFSDLDSIRVTTANIYSYFTGATTQNKKTLCEFKIENSELAPTGGYVTLAIKGFVDGYIFRWQLYRCIYGGQGQLISESEFSAIEPVNMSEQIAIKVVAGYFARNGYEYYGFGITCLMYDDKETQSGIYYIQVSNFPNAFGNGTPSGQDVSPEFGPASEPQGGYNSLDEYPKGTFDFTSDEIPIDPVPSIGVTTAGFINVYKIEEDDLQSLGEKLFPHFLPAELLGNPSTMNVSEMIAILIKMCYGTLISPVGSAIEFNDNLGIFDILMNGKLIDYILDCHIIPVSITHSSINPLRVGYRTFEDLQLEKITSDYVIAECGSLSIDEAFGNFLDYSCKVELYLPFVGFVNIPNEYWNNGTISVTYVFNVIDGSFQAKVKSTRRDNKMQLKNAVIGQYGGVCCVHLPITGLQYSNVVSGLVNGSLNIVSNAGAGDYGGVGTNAMKMLNLRPEAPMSNGYNASSSFLAQRTPYLVIKYPASQFSEMYMKEQGLPLNVPYQLSTISGFTIIDNPILSIQCTDEEYNEIVSLMKSGIIL